MAISRRKAIGLLLGSSAAAVAGGAAGFAWLDYKFNPHTPLHYEFPPDSGVAPRLAATPACRDGDAPTARTIEGPFYRPDSPQRTVLRDAETFGRPLVIEGSVLTEDCRPVVGAVLDFWSCDGRGVYDKEGFRLRGHQFTGGEGRFRVETVKPSDYRQFGIHRAPHVHVKVQGRDTPLLTTQLFFPGEPLNAQDWFVKDSLMLKVEQAADGTLLGRFDFILRRA